MLLSTSHALPLEPMLLSTRHSLQGWGRAVVPIVCMRYLPPACATTNHLYHTMAIPHHTTTPPHHHPPTPGMAYATLSSLPEIYGLYASTIAGYVYAFFGTSGQLTLGPVALVRAYLCV